MIERRDRDDHAGQRFTLRKHAALLAVRRQIAGKTLAVVAQRLDRGEFEHVGHAADFVTRILLRQTRLQRNQIRRLFRALTQQRSRAFENLRALIARERRAVVRGVLERVAHVVDARHRHGADARIRVRIEHIESACTRRTLALQPQRSRPEAPAARPQNGAHDASATWFKRDARRHRNCAGACRHASTRSHRFAD